MEKILRENLKNGKFEGLSRLRSKQMAAVRSQGNRTTELALRMALIRAGISGWKINDKSVLGKPDFYFTTSRLAVFVDGCFWHGCPICGHIPKTNTAYWETKIMRNSERDKKVNCYLLGIGIQILRIWEHELCHDRNRVLNTIVSALRNGKSHVTTKT